MAFAFLDRDRSIAHPGLQPLARPTRCPGHPPFHRPGLRLLGLQEPAARPARRRRLHLEPQRGRLHLLHRHRLPRNLRRRLRCMARAGRPPPGHVLLRPLLRLRLCDRLGPGCTIQPCPIYLGYGVVGGIGLGLGYISPVSTLIKWFPDRPGLATGLAIMGFGGGAMIGGPLASQLMAYFKAAGQPSISYTLVTMGVLYFVFMMFGVFTIRVPREGWKPEGWSVTTKPPPSSPPTTSTSHTPGRPHSSGCSGSSSSPTSPPASASSSRPAHDPGPLQRPASAPPPR